MQLIWAFRPLAALKKQTGFVECSDALAKTLLASGDVQEADRGALKLNEIELDYKEPRKPKPAPAPVDPVVEPVVDPVAAV